MKIVLIGNTKHELIVNKMITEDFVANPEIANVSLKALGLKIKTVVVEKGETVVFLDNLNENLLLG